MIKFKDLTGMKFGRLTVISINEEESNKLRGKSQYKARYWNCICDCGNECIASGGDLKSGDKQSCGCLCKEKTSEKNKKDMRGKKFGKLTVLKENGKNKYGEILWDCECECGNICTVSGTLLRNGHTKSCGCIKIDRLKSLWDDDEYRKNMSELATERNIEMWKDEEFKKTLKEKIKKSWEDEERRKVASEATRKQWEDEEFRKMNSGENSPLYNHDLTEEERKERENGARSPESIKWSKQVKIKANYVCDCCGKSGGNLVSHHLNCRKYFKEQRYDINNGVCLCEECHKEFHRLMGGYKIKCTKEDYEKFKNDKTRSGSYEY